MPPLTDGDVGATKPVITAALGATVTDARTGAGLLYGVWIKNTSATVVAYLQIFDLVASSVTLGTTVPNMSLGVAPNDGVPAIFFKPLKFANGISGAGTTTWNGNSAAAVDVTWLIA